MTGYGESVWFDAQDHTALHRQLVRDRAATQAAILRRPVLQRSVQRCQTCTELLTDQVEPAVDRPAEPQALHARFTLEDLQQLLVPALELPPGHRLVAAYTEQASVLTLVVHCPDGEEPHGPRA